MMRYITCTQEFIKSSLGVYNNTYTIFQTNKNHSNIFNPIAQYITAHFTVLEWRISIQIPLEEPTEQTRRKDTLELSLDPFHIPGHNPTVDAAFRMYTTARTAFSSSHPPSVLFVCESSRLHFAWLPMEIFILLAAFFRPFLRRAFHFL